MWWSTPFEVGQLIDLAASLFLPLRTEFERIAKEAYCIMKTQGSLEVVISNKWPLAKKRKTNKTSQKKVIQIF